MPRSQWRHMLLDQGDVKHPPPSDHMEGYGAKTRRMIVADVKIAYPLHIHENDSMTIFPCDELDDLFRRY